MKPLAALAALLALTGCGILHPQTKISAGPFGWSFSDGKDNDIEIRDAKYDPTTHEFNVGLVKVTNSASAPIAANVEQLRMVNEQIRIHGENIAQSLGLITALAEKVIPGFQVPKVAPESAGFKKALLDALLNAVADAKPVQP